MSDVWQSVLAAIAGSIATLFTTRFVTNFGKLRLYPTYYQYCSLLRNEDGQLLSFSFEANIEVVNTKSTKTTMRNLRFVYYKGLKKIAESVAYDRNSIQYKNGLRGISEIDGFSIDAKDIVKLSVISDVDSMPEKLIGCNKVKFVYNTGGRGDRKFLISKNPIQIARGNFRMETP